MKPVYRQHSRGVVGLRLTSLFLALAIALGLVQAASTSAHADPSGPLTKFDWEIGSLVYGGADAHDEYWAFIDRLHQTSGHDIPNHPEVASTLDETTLLPTRLLEARVVEDGEYWGSLYFWADNLYLAGFYQPGYSANGVTHPGRHYAFPDVWPTEFQQVLGVSSVTRLPWNGNYANLPGGSTDARAARVITHNNIADALEAIRRAPDRLAQDSNAFGRQLVLLIQATSEAARFGRIFDNIRGNIRDYTSHPMTAQNVALQQAWDNLSSWVYRRLGGSNEPYAINNITFQTLAAWLAYVGYMELHAKVPR